MMPDPPSPAGVHVSLLGGFSITVAGKPVDDHWRLRKAQTLVKLLALAPGHRLHREVVAERLWPDAKPEAAANNLHQIVHNIRSISGGMSWLNRALAVFPIPGGHRSLIGCIFFVPTCCGSSATSTVPWKRPRRRRRCVRG